MGSKIGSSIRAIRLMRNLTQEQLAERVGIDQNYLSRIELGKRNTTLETLQKISSALNVNYAVLILFSEISKESLSEFSPLAFEHVWNGEKELA